MQSAAVRRNPGWTVTFAGLGINLALGVLYTWSVISKGVPAAWNWSETDKSLPYAIACLVFCLIMIPAGRMCTLEEVGDFVAALDREETEWFNGANIDFAGGRLTDAAKSPQAFEPAAAEGCAWGAWRVRQDGVAHGAVQS